MADTKKAKAPREKTASTATNGALRVTLVRSTSRTVKGHRETVRGLGLKWTNHTVEVEDTPAVRGMIRKVGYLLKVSGE
ncbi:MAG TPA: 50S ribosomal protein L30 [Casimicrobiaceae bacterium]|nr:50S ribosomal protein L30 [Casimicrobiaceae bacterium]